MSRKLVAVCLCLSTVACVSKTAVITQVSVPAARAPQTTAVQPPSNVKAHVSFAGTDNPIKERKFLDLTNYTVEQILLNNKSVLSLRISKGDGLVAGYTDADKLRVETALPFFKDKGIVYDAAKVKKSGPFTYMVQSSDTFNCFIYHTTFGGTVTRDREIYGTLCYTVI